MKCFTFKNGTEYVNDVESIVLNSDKGIGVNYPDPTMWGSIKAFASIMYAFAGASTFPTIQADMKEKQKFKWSAYMACILLFLMHLVAAYPILTNPPAQYFEQLLNIPSEFGW